MRAHRHSAGSALADRAAAGNQGQVDGGHQAGGQCVEVGDGVDGAHAGGEAAAADRIGVDLVAESGLLGDFGAALDDDAVGVVLHGRGAGPVGGSGVGDAVDVLDDDPRLVADPTADLEAHGAAVTGLDDAVLVLDPFGRGPLLV